MEHFIRIAFWIVTFSGCLLAKSLPEPPIDLSDLTIDLSDLNIEIMRQDVKCEEDSKFYTPSKVEAQCMTAALDCFEKELETVRKECVVPESSILFIYQAKETLTRASEQWEKKKGKVPKESTECACENWPETSFDNFLNKTESLVQRVNSS